MRTRLAPSPTGALHLGNARTFLVNWALARQRGWTVVLRIEDLDGPRVKEGADAEAIDILQWLGLDWDEGPFYQLDDLSAYHEALQQLAKRSYLYPCRCTRAEIIQANLSAPHGDDHELRYPGTCRPDERNTSASYAPQPDVAWRVRTPAGPTRFDDEFAGGHSYDVQAAVGDFIVADKRGLPSYQLAVVVDDSRQRIDCIVRGDDLLSSTHRQRLLQRRLEMNGTTQYWHLPLVVGEDGRRLAKRHGDSRIAKYRSDGASPNRVIGLLAEWCGVGPRAEMTAGDFLSQFRLDRVPHTPIIYRRSDDEWLLGGGLPHRYV
ncbi:MAG: tRNA glutamyl-Q(34) synthetase GluQRS [Planctomycetota bacterium]